MRDSLARRRLLAQKIVATQPYRPGLLSQVLALITGMIGYAVIALIKAIVWAARRRNREMAADKMRQIARAAAERAPQTAELKKMLRNAADRVPDAEVIDRMLGIADAADAPSVGGLDDLDDLLDMGR